jgi:hypothetical protein
VPLAASCDRTAAAFASAVREPNDFDGVSEMMRKKPDALFVITDPLTLVNRKQLFELARHNR